MSDCISTKRPRLHAMNETSTRYWLREPNHDDVQDIAAWLAQSDINRWFDFGLGRQSLPALAVHAMLHAGRHRIRVFGPAGYRTPSGLVAVSDVTHRFATGSFWVLRDRHRPAYPNMTYDASKHLLREAFECDRLSCITAWALQCNAPSQRLLAKLGFRLIGLQRECHLIEGMRDGRLLYDLLPDDLAVAPNTR
ncbi:N-acetyltransferase [Burkholderia sp. Bp8963]|uniref:GNAT family N-acetyltransferase n=1 Tax=Burkholderia sp. Bp8963 TaxID=2184547 RepID=UPI000F5A5E68|nr:GNAT family protein [Burkholderia sp. Bp8963]RQS69206.1 N-acetyltransferase [Burkholderia sp. Bp8963]